MFSPSESAECCVLWPPKDNVLTCVRAMHVVVASTGSILVPQQRVNGVVIWRCTVLSPSHSSFNNNTPLAPTNTSALSLHAWRGCVRAQKEKRSEIKNKNNR
jgi:hypothetical protein